jgi:hypothetical protein
MSDAARCRHRTEPHRTEPHRTAPHRTELKTRESRLFGIQTQCVKKLLFEKQIHQYLFFLLFMFFDTKRQAKNA